MTIADFVDDEANRKQWRSAADHGPLLSGEPLWKALGYPSAVSFRKACSRGHVAVPIFRLPHRRGFYAFTKDVAHWLEKLETEVRARD